MKREYMEENVYDAFLRRMKLIFEEFDHIFISFSGGKDSGLLLNLVLDYKENTVFFLKKNWEYFIRILRRSMPLHSEYIRTNF